MERLDGQTFSLQEHPMTNPLFTPFTLGSLELPNRIVMAPMTRSFAKGGYPGDNVAEYYARRAANDVGLLITEGTHPDRKAAGNDAGAPFFYGDALEGWKRVVARVKEEGGRIAPQLWHTGFMRKPGAGHFPDAPSESPSGVTHTGSKVMPEPSEAEVIEWVESFARSAGYAKDLGFDAVEIHGAHGYLIDQFFWSVMNQREDKYGGGLPERATFAAEIIKECRKAIGPDMPLIIRVSQWKQQDFTQRLAETPQELEAFLTVLTDAGVDCLHCSQRRFWEPEFPDIDPDLNFAGWAKKLTGKPTITVGSVGLSGEFVAAFAGESSKPASLDRLIEMLDRGDFDLVAVGRALLQDPEWVVKVRDGREDELQDYTKEALATLY
jgi:2,4-dienoyl-CoA reductase-like NADH-dependent reductase (Old Yellow Enzyme family)